MTNITTDAFTDLLDTLDRADSGADTHCAGWTVHELVAHLAAGSAEMADLGDDAVNGRPPRPTRGFGEREAPMRLLAPAALHERLIVEAARVLEVATMLEQQGTLVPFTGVELSGDKLLLHGATELVLHRWDIVGDDDLGIKNLSHPDVATHVVETISRMSPKVLPLQDRTVVQDHGPITMRCPGQRDVVIGEFGVRFGTDGPVVDCHPAARALMLWGRMPTSPELRPSDSPDEVLTHLGEWLGLLVAPGSTAARSPRG